MDGIVGSVHVHPLEDLSDYPAYRFPDPEHSTGLGPIDWQAFEREVARQKARGEMTYGDLRHGHTFQQLCDIRGYLNTLMDLSDEEPETLDCMEQVIQFGILAAKAGAHGLAMGDSVSALVSPRMYREYVQLYAQQMIRRLKEATGLPVFYHVCGDTNHILEYMVQTGADCIEVDSPVDMARARQIAAGRCCVEGNVSTIEALLQGTKEDVRREADHILQMFGNRGGVILSGACEIPRHSPRENVAELMRAAVEFPY